MIDISKLIPSKRSKEYAYKMGFDSSVNGVNTENCHFSIFSSDENTRSWEAGVKDGVAHNKADKVNYFKCDVCGRFIGYQDLDNGKAVHQMILPDSDYSSETYETLCPVHNNPLNSTQKDNEVNCENIHGN